MTRLDYVSKGAQLSRCGTYRYRLWREWRLHPEPAQWSMWTDDRGKPVLDGAGAQLGDPKACVFIMLNPSTADANDDDPTIRRCVGFARAWGYDRMEVLNLFAYRATDPRALLSLNHNDDPVGEGNQGAFDHVMTRDYPVGKIICAWGAHGGHLGQDETALGWIGDRERFALGMTKDGHPKHPLYLPAKAEPVRFRP
ncbi:hypothetical protein X740_33330 [Mesorhizobium sp. LNHC221B00]|uniref:DUF1643 domain-containing protein n=1 Tax=Mesorhizobium sp. LNHC221B00 TaxID=1287233 RepID=UPI0003CF9A6B|nr:DUF1643 domain-containing protein [Mesorhizobium sp. LNHC221B00]ESY72333.1 hypothetical protein X740_33330 [Mesorhizobium sp. LNHC221B00]